VRLSRCWTVSIWRRPWLNSVRLLVQVGRGVVVDSVQHVGQAMQKGSPHYLLKTAR